MKIKDMQIRFLDEAKACILEKNIMYIPIKENMIIAKSIEFYDDPEPCMIHRSAVMKRLVMELFEYFLECLSKNQEYVVVDKLQGIVKEYVNFPENTMEIYIHKK